MSASHATCIGACGEKLLKLEKEGKKIDEKAILSAGKGLRSYVMGFMQEHYSSQEPERFSNKATDRGNELESSAILLYEFESGNVVKPIGFVEHSEYAGVSPDGYINEDGLLEAKCPLDKEFFRRLTGGKIDSGYIWQMEMELLVCKKKFCVHAVYNPNFKKKLILDIIYPDKDKFAALKKGLEIGEMFIKEFHEKMEQLNKH